MKKNLIFNHSYLLINPLILYILLGGLSYVVAEEQKGDIGPAKTDIIDQKTMQKFALAGATIRQLEDARSNIKELGSYLIGLSRSGEKLGPTASLLTKSRFITQMIRIRDANAILNSLDDDVILSQTIQQLNSIMDIFHDAASAKAAIDICFKLIGESKGDDVLSQDEIKEISKIYFEGYDYNLRRLKGPKK